VNLSDPKQLLDLLRQMTRKAQECELAARLMGENFNVFKILNLQTTEVRTHSAFLAKLLDPRGSHGQDAAYLRLFVSQLGLRADTFDPEGATVKVEHHVGQVDHDEGTGGRIDIMLTDVHNRRILIENKIHAGDLDKQLLRYHKAFPTAVLIYLTLFGKVPSEISMGGEDFPVTLMSYKLDIVRWLDECHKASVTLPVVRETILQYKCLIRELTHQAMGDKVNEQATNLILANPELADSVEPLWEALQDVIRRVKVDFEKRMNVMLMPPYRLDNDISIERKWGEDEDGVWIGFRAVGKQTEDACKEAQKYVEVFQSLVPSPGWSKIWNIGWYNPDPFKPGDKFEHLSKSLILSLYKNETTQMKFVNKILDQANDVTKRLIDGVGALSKRDEKATPTP
jgi:hypothetical protein